MHKYFHVLNLLTFFVLGTKGNITDDSINVVQKPVFANLSNRPSLAKIILSLDTNAARQQALGHVLSALQIMYARYVDNTCS